MDDWSREWDEGVIRSRGLWREGARGQWRRCARDGELEEEKRRWWRWWSGRKRVSNFGGDKLGKQNSQPLTGQKPVFVDPTYSRLHQRLSSLVLMR